MPEGTDRCAKCGASRLTEAAPQAIGVSTPLAATHKPEGTNGLAIASLVLGIIGVALSITIILGIVLGILAVIFGLIGMNRSSRSTARTHRKKAIAGTTLGMVALLIAGMSAYAFSGEINTVIQARNVPMEVLFCDVSGIDASVRWTGGGTRDITFDFQAVDSRNSILWSEEKTFTNVGADSYQVSIDFPASVSSQLYQCLVFVTDIE